MLQLRSALCLGMGLFLAILVQPLQSAGQDIVGVDNGDGLAVSSIEAVKLEEPELALRKSERVRHFTNLSIITAHAWIAAVLQLEVKFSDALWRDTTTSVETYRGDRLCSYWEGQFSSRGATWWVEFWEMSKDRTCKSTLKESDINELIHKKIESLPFTLTFGFRNSCQRMQYEEGSWIGWMGIATMANREESKICAKEFAEVARIYERFGIGRHIVSEASLTPVATITMSSPIFAIDRPISTSTVDLKVEVAMPSLPPAPVSPQFSRIVLKPALKAGWTFSTQLGKQFVWLSMYAAIFLSSRRPRNQIWPLSVRLLVGSVTISFLVPATRLVVIALKCYSPIIALYIPRYFSTNKAEDEMCPGPATLQSLYSAFYIGHVIEIFSSALQGRSLSTDTQIMLSDFIDALEIALSAQKLSVELLITSLLWSSKYLSLCIFSMLDLQNYRLIPSAVFWIITVSYIAVSRYYAGAQIFSTSWLLGLPPLPGVQCVVLMCGTVYLLGSLFEGGLSTFQLTMQRAQIEYSDDFHCCLLKLGVLVVTYLYNTSPMTESPSLAVPDITWIERPEYKHCILFTSIDHSREYYDGVNDRLGMVVRRKRTRKRPREVTPSTSGYASYSLRRGRIQDLMDTEVPDRLRGIILVDHLRILYRLGMLCLLLCMNVMQNVFHRMWRKLRPSEQLDDREEPMHGEAVNELTEKAVNRVSSDSEYYSRFLHGDTFPEDDNSGDFVPSDKDEETTPDVTGASCDLTSSSQHQEEPMSDQLSPELCVSEITLSSLLLPQASYEIQLARIMRAHLSANEIVTRGKMRTMNARNSKRDDFDHWSSNDSDLDNDDGPILARIINERRRRGAQTISSDHGEEYEGDGVSPLESSRCVICHASQRNIVLWPCRCLTVCEECRATVAQAKLNGCVCCRRKVVSYSRLNIP
ncbi:uncharacterized protein V1513DRAFT_470112 [Lipomyces chichibuensis]|uniref:uncharacterized protein n=1 Tax=Lipomyces chichibuensis TaxID=1546026 RepID=UPI0033433BD9